MFKVKPPPADKTEQLELAINKYTKKISTYYTASRLPIRYAKLIKTSYRLYAPLWKPHEILEELLTRKLIVKVEGMTCNHPWFLPYEHGASSIELTKMVMDADSYEYNQRKQKATRMAGTIIPHEKE